MAKIYETKDYRKFHLHEMNRAIKNTTWLRESMEKYGWIDAYPMHVVKNGDGKYKIKAGHHRFSVARELKIPVKYVICDDDAHILDLEKASRHWSVREYVEAFQRQQNRHYIELLSFHRKTKIPITNCATLLSGWSSSGGTMPDTIKSGKFVVKDRTFANTVADIVIKSEEAGLERPRVVTHVNAVAACVRVPSFDADRYIDKLKAHSHLLRRCASAGEYMEMIEKIYNRQARRDKKDNIAFKAKNLSAERIRKAHGGGK